MTNHYKTLGVSNFSSTNEIKTAYRKLSKKFHPDVNQGDKFFEERFKEIQNAYEALNDSNKRKILDDFLKQSETKSQYQNYQSKKGADSNESKKNEQTKDETHKTYSNTKTTNARNDYTSQQNKPSNPQKTTSNSFVFIVVGLIIVLVVVLVVLSKKNEKGEYDNYSSKSTETYVPQNYDNYQPSNTQQEYDKRTDELPSSTNSNGNFSIGSNKQEVLNIQGNPTRTMKLDALNEEIWNY
ncbi:J domain-containing protein, partial [Runella sp.]|uniref:J domain-containing protein n=1 Tax=Runella sp. TaxID=1960881 RepID=UPI0030170396